MLFDTLTLALGLSMGAVHSTHKSSNDNRRPLHTALFLRQIPSADLERLIKASTANFRDRSVTPVVRTGEFWTMELFHGPTFAFKVRRGRG
jgi:threonine synthase